METRRNRWKIIASGNGKGDQFNQLNCPTCIHIDDDYSLCILGTWNHRVIKWINGSKQGIMIASENHHIRLSSPYGITIDRYGQMYVVDRSNSKIMHLGRENSVVIGGNGHEKRDNQLHSPNGLSFDLQNNLYVIDECNYRIQKFEIISN